MTIELIENETTINLESFNIERIIEPVYDVFSKYSMIHPMESNPYWHQPDETDILSMKPLRSLTIEDIGRYPQKAITTWGNEENFKYLLPRLLELEVFKKPYSFFHIPSKFECADFNSWPTEEKDILEVFFSQYFVYLISINEGYCADELVEEIKKIFPNFLFNNTKIFNIIKKLTYSMLDYTQVADVNDNDYIRLIYLAFGKKAIIDYVITWPEDIENLLKFAKLVNDFLDFPIEILEETKSKLQSIRLLLKNHQSNQTKESEQVIYDVISNSILALDLLIEYVPETLKDNPQEIPMEIPPEKDERGIFSKTFSWLTRLLCSSKKSSTP